MRRSPENPFTNPTLVGAMTVLAIVLAVYLAYSANQGLPFLPTRELKVDVTNGANLVVGADVDSGGTRIGELTALQPVEIRHTGQVAAQLTLTLSKANGRVPINSTVSVGERSLLGQKFVELNKGNAKRVFADGGTMPISQTSIPVQIDDVFNTFTPQTRTAVQGALVGIGSTLAGRGEALSQTLQNLPPLLGNLAPVAANLANPQTEITRFFNNTDTFTAVVAPLSQVNAQLFTDMARTFSAISRVPRNLEATIAESPSTLSVSTQSLRVQQPFLVDLATLGNQLTPATRELRAALPDINPALEAGATTLARTPVLNRGLQHVMASLRNLALSPGTNIAINALTATANTLNPMLRYLGPYVTVCNYFNYFWTYLADNVSETTSFGTSQRVLLKLANILQPNNVGIVGATTQVNGGGANLGLLGGNEYLHNQPYGAAIDTQGNADCETGQRGYPLKLNSFDSQGRTLAVDPHTPGNQGPTYAGVAHVPAGETFSRTPQTGPQLDPNPSNP
ncbi:MAG: MlaD family protein [Actinomycetota bacterium]|nr:MlaD family protein [Actinomycetota bacterium]